MIVDSLIEILQRHSKDGKGNATILITESEYDWKNVLKIIPKDGTPDEAIEINF